MLVCLPHCSLHVRCVGARPWEHGPLYASGAQITLYISTHLCGCGVLNEVSKFIGGCKICTNVICLALNSHGQCKTFVLGGVTLC